MKDSWILYKCCVDAGHIAIVPKGVFKERGDRDESLNYEISIPAGNWEVSAMTKGWMNEVQVVAMKIELAEDTEFIVGDTCYWIDRDEASKLWDLYEENGGKSSVLNGNIIYLNTGGDGMIDVHIRAERVEQ